MTDDEYLEKKNEIVATMEPVNHIRSEEDVLEAQRVFWDPRIRRLQKELGEALEELAKITKPHLQLLK